MASKIMHGARGILCVGNQKAGIFNSVSYSTGYDAQPAYILGRFSPATVEYTGAEPVNLTCSGFRVLDNGPFGGKDGGWVPKLQDLLNYEDITVTLTDRVTGEVIMEVQGVKPTGFSSQMAARALQDLTVQMIGLHYSDESGDSEEGGKATFLP